MQWLQTYCTSQHNVEITEIYSHIFGQKFRESDVFIKGATKELISRNIFFGDIRLISRFSTLWSGTTVSVIFQLPNNWGKYIPYNRSLSLCFYQKVYRNWNCKSTFRFALNFPPWNSYTFFNRLEYFLLNHSFLFSGINQPLLRQNILINFSCITCKKPQRPAILD